MLSLARAAEIDSYTYMGAKKSADRIINHNMHVWLKHATIKLNSERIQCPRNVEEAEPIYKIIKGELPVSFIGHSIAVYYDSILPDSMIQRTPFDFSIYATLSWLEGFSLNLKGLLGVMKIGRRNIGVDKLGHFLVEGWGFYKRAYLREDASVRKAVEWGKFTERTYFGKTTTGVYSHADLVANYNGMRFWNQLFLFSKDPVANTSPSYISKPMLKCHEGQWELNSKFNFRRFVDNSWDESLNCNEYDTEEIRNKVIGAAAHRIGYKKLKESGGRVCPMVKRSCRFEKAKYGIYAKDLLHESCFDDSLSYKVEPKRYDFKPIRSLFLNSSLELLRRQMLEF